MMNDDNNNPIVHHVVNPALWDIVNKADLTDDDRILLRGMVEHYIIQANSMRILEKICKSEADKLDEICKTIIGRLKFT